MPTIQDMNAQTISIESLGLAATTNNTQDKASLLTNKVQEKASTLAGKWEPAMIESFPDADSPQIVGITGSKGKGGDLTGQLTEDRDPGFDAYEIAHPNDPYRNTNSAEMKYERQRQRLETDPEFAAKIGVKDIKNITDDDIARAGTWEQLMGLYNAIPGTKAAWEPGPLDYYDRNRGIELGSKENPLNIPVERRDTGSIDYFGRPLAEIRNKDTGVTTKQALGYDGTEDTSYSAVKAKASLAAQDKLTPELAAYLDKNEKYVTNPTTQAQQLTVTKTPMYSSEEFNKKWDKARSDNKGYGENLIDAVQYGLGRTAATIGDAVADAVVTNDAAKWLHDKGVDTSWIDEKNDFVALDKYKTAKEYGYDDKRIQGYVQEFKDTFNNEKSTWADKTLVVLKAIQHAPEVFASSSGDIAVAATGLPGMAALAAGQTNEVLAQRAENKGTTDLDAQDYGIATASGIAYAAVNMLTRGNAGLMETKKVLAEAAKHMDKSAFNALVTKVGEGATIEGMEELFQGVTEVVGSKLATPKEDEILTRDTAIDLGAQGALGAGGGVVGAVPGSIKDSLPARQKKEEVTTTVPEEDKVTELTPEEKSSISNLAAGLANGSVDFNTDPKSIMDTIYKHEELLSRAKEGPSKQAVQEEFTKAKQAINNVLANMDEENPITFGSRQDAENFISYAVENNVNEKGELAEEISRKLSKVANKAGIDEKTFKRIKDSYTVQFEAEEGKRGYNSYARDIQALLSNKDADPELVKKKVRNATEYLASQERYVTELEAGIEKANDLIAAANKPGGKLLDKQVKISIDQKVGTSKWTINIGQDENGKYSINQATLDLLEAKKGNVAGIRAALKGTSAELKSKGIEIANDEFKVPTSDSTEQEALRAADRTYYEKAGVNKVILGDKTTKKWKHYKVGNEDFINTGEYTKDDVVLINTTSLEDYTGTHKKTGKDTQMKVLPKAVQDEIKKAVKAGAKIVIDRDMIPTRGKAADNTDTYKAYGAIKKLLTRYVGKDSVYSNLVNEETGKRKAGTFMPKEEAEKFNTKAKEKYKVRQEEAKKVKEAEHKVDSVVAERLANKDSKTGITKSIVDALKDKYSKEGDTDAQIAEKIMRAGATRVKKKVSAAVMEISNNTSFTAVNENVNLYTSEVMKMIGDDKNVLELVKQSVEDRINTTKNTGSLLTKLKMLKEEALETGDSTDLELFYMEHADNNQVVVAMEDSYSKGAEDLYVWAHRATDGSLKEHRTTNKDSIGKNYGKAVWQTAIPRDVNKIAKVKNVTALTLAPVESLGSAELESMTNTGVKALKEIIGSVQEENKSSNKDYWLYDSPARGLVFDRDGNVNKTVVTAMVLSLGELIQNNGYMMTDRYKSADDMANMLGLDNAFGINKEVRDLIGKAGMLQTTAVDSLSKSIVTQLGITNANNKEYDAQAFDALRADLANMALLIGVNKNVGMLELVNDISAKEYAKTVLGMEDTSGIAEDAKVLFVRAKTTESKEGVSEFVKPVQNLLENYKAVIEQMPLENTLRKEPSLHRLSEKEISQAVSKIRKDLAEMSVPKEAKQALTALMEQEWTADVELINEALEVLKDYKDLVGYVDENSAEFKAMMFDERDSQIAVNRDIDKKMLELGKLVDGSKEDISLWFKWFYTKNQRYMMDANTVNPQTGKQLERFLIYPKSFKQTLKTAKDENGKFKFERKGKDVTLEIKASIAQAMGFGIDKKHSEEAVELADTLLGMDPKTFIAFKQELLATKHIENSTYNPMEIEGTSYVIKAEVEHFGHALQALAVLDAVINGKEIKTPLSAEYDAITSGFGIKQFQLPMNTAAKGKEAEFKHMPKVGFYIRQGAEFGMTDKEILAPEVFGAEMILDSYQGLGAGMPSKQEMVDRGVPVKGTKETSFYFDTKKEFPKGTEGKKQYKIAANMNAAKWAKIVEVIPSKNVDGTVSKALRTIFKYPFMTFNYASALKSVRKLLANSLTESMLKDMYKAEDGDARWNGLAEVIVGAMGKSLQGDAARNYLVKMLNERSANEIDVDGIKLFDYVSTIVNMSVGEEAEAIFKKEFGDYIYTQKVITNSFSAVAEVFTMEYEEALAKLREKGPVTKQDLKEILKSLKDKFPAVAGPLSAELDGSDGVAIIDSKNTTPGDTAYKGRDEAKTKLAKETGKLLGTKDQQTINAHYRIKKFVAAVSAGAVVPIHAIDGAMMAKLINWCKSQGIDIVAIHDAIIVAPEHTLAVTKKYNELMYSVNKDYNLLQELKNLVDRTLGKLDLADAKYKRELKAAMLDESGKAFKTKKVKLREFIEEAVSNLDKSVTDNNAARKELFDLVDKYGAWSSHMAPLPGGAYEIKPSSEAEAEVKAKDSKIAAELNVSIKDINRVKNNMCGKG